MLVQAEIPLNLTRYMYYKEKALRWMACMELQSYEIFAKIATMLLTLRVLSANRPGQETLSWILAFIIMPIFSGIIYIITQENPLGRKRQVRIKKLDKLKSKSILELQSNTARAIKEIDPSLKPILTLNSWNGRFQAQVVRSLELFSDESETFISLIENVKTAKYEINLCSYLWVSSGKVKELEDQLIAAQSRGVQVRMILDELGSSAFFASERFRHLKNQGINIVAALRAGLISAFFRRIDVRNHRKLCVIDGRIAYSGSMNIVESSKFKPWHKLSKWVDMTIKVCDGPAESLNNIFVDDWFVETGQRLNPKVGRKKAVGSSMKIGHDIGSELIQFVPTGFDTPRDHLLNVVLTVIYQASETVTITSPYFCPPDLLIKALCSAAMRDVKVCVVTTSKSDAKLVKLASEYNFNELTNAGVDIFLFQKGMLHSKTLTADNKISMIGSPNFDCRSFSINFELSSWVFGETFNKKLKKLQSEYISNSVRIDYSWLSKNKTNSWRHKISRLLSPIL